MAEILYIGVELSDKNFDYGVEEFDGSDGEFILKNSSGVNSWC